MFRTSKSFGEEDRIAARLAEAGGGCCVALGSLWLWSLSLFA